LLIFLLPGVAPTASRADAIPIIRAAVERLPPDVPGDLKRLAVANP
jgi:hypothetical protein